MKKIHHARGFTLIEVMLALLILAVGILAISKLQGTLIKNSSNANQRAVAVSLAQKKIDDLRSFTETDLTGGSDWGCPSPGLSAASLAYADIADNEGGAPLCDPELLANTNIPIGNTNYQLSWDVTPYEFVTNVPTAMNDASTAAPTVDFKNVEITVSWLDVATGNNASVALSTILDAYDPGLTALSGTTNAGGAPIYSSYTPEAAPDVIDVEVNTGDGTKRQTSKPLPDAVSQGQNANTIVTFEVVTYQTNPLDANAFVQTRREEFTTVDCKCTLSASDGITYPPAHAVWDDTDKERYDYVGSPISKPTATQTNNVNAVDEVCTTCCRDHHDDDASSVKYVAGTTSGNHAHYDENGNTVVSGEYLESCRMKLVDGVLRVFQDWNLIDFTVMNRDDLSDGDPLQAQYTAYVDQLIKNQIEPPIAIVKPPLRTPLNTAVGSINQLQSRGVYLDEVYDLTGSLSSEYSTYVADSNNADRLEKVPFAEVNLTLLSFWESADELKVSVTDDRDIATISDPANDYYGTYNRGEATSLDAAASPGIAITSTMHPSNDGITNKIVTPLSSLSDAVSVIVSGVAPSPITVNGSISAPTLPNKTTFSISGCGIPDKKGEFSCTIASGDDLNIILTANYEITTGSGNSKITTPYSCSTSYSESNVIADIPNLTMELSSCPP